MAVTESDLIQFECRDECGCPDFELDVRILNGLIDFKRRQDPRFRGRSDADIAEMCNVSETTYKAIKAGRNRKPRIDILYSIVYTFGGSIDRMVGLAPPRDFANEAAVYDATLMDTMRSRVAELERQRADDGNEMSRLRLRVLEISEERGRALGRVETLEAELNAHARTIRNLEAINTRNVRLVRTLASGMLMLCGMLIAVCVIAWLT